MPSMKIIENIQNFIWPKAYTHTVIRFRILRRSKKVHKGQHIIGI